MKLKTSMGNEYTVDFADVAILNGGNLMIQMQENRRLPEIAQEFDGLEWLKRESENQGNKEFSGYSVLNRISRKEDGSVLIGIGKENE